MRSSFQFLYLLLEPNHSARTALKLKNSKFPKSQVVLHSQVLCFQLTEDIYNHVMDVKPCRHLINLTGV